MNTYKKYCLLTLVTTVLISFYPLYMGVRVIYDYLRFGAVDAANYPKYVIPDLHCTDYRRGSSAVHPKTVRKTRHSFVICNGYRLFFYLRIAF